MGTTTRLGNLERFIFLDLKFKFSERFRFRMVSLFFYRAICKKKYSLMVLIIKLTDRGILHIQLGFSFILL